MDTSAGFRQEERLAYAGGLVEWAPSRAFALGAFATTLWAQSERTRLAPAAPVAEYHLTERTTQVGLMAVARPSGRWRADGWVVYNWRPERRVFLSGADPDVDFLLRGVHAMAVATYRAPGGLLLRPGVGLNLNRTPRGAGQVPAKGSLEETHVRFRYEVGWRVRDQFRFTIGASSDLNDEGVISFGGARGGMLLVW